MKIPYRETTSIWLNLKDYTNTGLSQSEIKEVIEKLHHQNNLFPQLTCEPSGFNHNLVITGLTCSSYVCGLIVDVLSYNLDQILYIKSLTQD